MLLGGMLSGADDDSVEVDRYSKQKALLELVNNPKASFEDWCELLKKLELLKGHYKFFFKGENHTVDGLAYLFLGPNSRARKNIIPMLYEKGYFNADDLVAMGGGMVSNKSKSFPPYHCAIRTNEWSLVEWLHDTLRNRTDVNVDDRDIKGRLLVEAALGSNDPYFVRNVVRHLKPDLTKKSKYKDSLNGRNEEMTVQELIRFRLGRRPKHANTTILKNYECALAGEDFPEEIRAHRMKLGIILLAICILLLYLLPDIILAIDRTPGPVDPGVSSFSKDGKIAGEEELRSSRGFVQGRENAHDILLKEL